MAYKYCNTSLCQNSRLFQDIGTRIEASRPLSRFNRLKVAVDIDHIIEDSLYLVSYGNNYIDQEYEQSFLSDPLQQ